MAMMKRIKIYPDIDSSELLESIPFSSPSEEETAMNACGSLLAQVISRDETPRPTWKGYLFSSKTERYDIYEPAVITLTDKRLLTAQWREDRIRFDRLPMSDYLGYIIQNSDGFILPEFDINFKHCSVSFLCRRGDADKLESSLCKELHSVRYQAAIA